MNVRSRYRRAVAALSDYLTRDLRLELAAMHQEVIGLRHNWGRAFRELRALRHTIDLAKDDTARIASAIERQSRDIETQSERITRVAAAVSGLCDEVAGVRDELLTRAAELSSTTVGLQAQADHPNESVNHAVSRFENLARPAPVLEVRPQSSARNGNIIPDLTTKDWGTKIRM